MPADVRANFDKFAEHKDFTGNMKYWPDLLTEELPEFNDSQCRKLYDLFQAVFETMSKKQKDFETKTETTKKFFDTWFGDGKLFNKPEPISGVEDRVKDFAGFLRHNKSQLSLIFNKKSRYLYLPEDFDYDSFVDDIEAGKYIKDPDLRDTLFEIVKYTQRYANSENSFYSDWPQDSRYNYNFTQPTTDGKPALPADTDEWFITRYNPAFKHRAREIFSKLVSSDTVFKDFQKYDSKGTISGEITRAIGATDYANKDSKDFVASKYNNQKNIFERVGEKLDDFKKDHLDPWFNILNGTRRFFSPYARNIVEAVSKVKIKGEDGKERKLSPTDGLKGILDNKDAIIKKLADKSPKAKAHFEWFAGKLSIYSEKMDKAFEGAFHNSAKMMAIVSRIIVDAIEESKVAEAESALEILSCMKYGIFHSKIKNAFKADKTSVLTNKDLFINKTSVGRFITGGLEKAGKFAMVAGIGTVAAIHNLTFRSRTKFNGKMKDIKDARDKWAKANDVEDFEHTGDALDKELKKAKRELRRLGTAMKLALNNNALTVKQAEQELDSQIQEKARKEQEIKAKQEEIKAKQARLQELQMQLEQIKQGLLMMQTGGSYMTGGGFENPDMNIQSLQAEKSRIEGDIANLNTEIANTTRDVTTLTNEVQGLTVKQQVLKNYRDKKSDVEMLKKQKEEVDSKKESWSDDHTDNYLKLMAHWDMLESFWKSHALTFNKKKMNDKWLENYGQKDENDEPLSKAEKFKKIEWLKYQAEYSNAA